MKRLLLVAFAFVALGCPGKSEPTVPVAPPEPTPDAAVVPEEAPKVQHQVDRMAIQGDWDGLAEGSKLTALSTKHERWLCAVGLGDKFEPNPENFGAGRAKENRGAELLTCGHTIESVGESNMVAGANFAMNPSAESPATQALKFEKVNDWRIAPIAYAVDVADKKLDFKMVARMVGRRVSLPNTCFDVRPSPDPDLYLKSAATIRKLAAKHDKVNKPRRLGDDRATIDTLHAYRVADRMQLASVMRHYLAGDVTQFLKAAEAQPSVTDNHRTCMAQWAWELGQNEQAKTWADWVVENGRSRDLLHAYAILSYLAADAGKWQDAVERAQQVFELRAKESNNAVLVSRALVVPIGVSLKAGKADHAKETAARVVKKEDLPQGTLVMAGVADAPIQITPENVQTLNWAAPDRSWAVTAALLIAAQLAEPSQREAVLDQLEPAEDLLAYYNGRQAIARWFGDEAAAKIWSQRKLQLHEKLADFQSAIRYSW